MNKKVDLVVVGAGVLGTFHALHAASLGKSVLLTEKDIYPVQATVRNFGQVVPSGMSSEWFEYGVASTTLYKKIQNVFDIGIRQNGSVYIASDESEQQLIHELKAVMESRDYECELLSQKNCVEKWPALKADYCREALYFPQEISAEPSITIYKLIEYACAAYPNLSYRPATTIIDCLINNSEVKVVTHQRELISAEKVVVCNGADFKILFPDQFRTSGIEVSKLQMLRTKPMPHVQLEGNILTGLTIRRYESFAELPSYATIATPEHLHTLKQWGIHILFKKGIDGSIIIGDSHEYADVNNMDDLGYDIKHPVNELMLCEAERIVQFDVRNIAATWAGFYAQHPDKDIVEIDLEKKIHIRTAIGGKGMTSAAGYSLQSIRNLFAR